MQFPFTLWFLPTYHAVFFYLPSDPLLPLSGLHLPTYCSTHVALNSPLPPPQVTAFFLLRGSSHLFLAYEQQVGAIIFLCTGT